MAAFVLTEDCPRVVKEEYLRSLERETVVEEVEPLLPTPPERNPRDIEQDDFMAGLGARLTTADLENIDEVEEWQAMREDGDGTDGDYSSLRTDESEDWGRDRAVLGLTPDDITAAAKWLEEVKANTVLETDQWQELYHVEDLNEQQRQVFDALLGHIISADEQGSRLIDLSGGAGTGKTRLLRTILQQAELATGTRQRIKVCAFTNSAASLFVGGTTLHRLFRLDVNRGSRPNYRGQLELQGARLGDLQEDFRDTRAVIIDEKSMVGSFTLWCVDQRLRQARPSHSHLPFGGLLVLLCGDLSQLPPVGDRALYAVSGKSTAQQQLGFTLYQQFKENYKLDVSMRQQGEHNQLFRQELGRLANGSFSIDNWRRWSTRELATLPAEERDRFVTTGIKLCSRKADMVSFNVAGLERTGSPLLLLKAVHNNRTAARATESQGQLPSLLPVARGASVVLTSNLWPEMKLLNGSSGTLTYVVYEEGKGPGDGLPTFLVVTFPQYTGPPFVPGEPGTVPIFSRLAEWREGKTNCVRRMYPLILGYALTIHKSQGKTSFGKFKLWYF